MNTANIYFDFNPPVITEPSVLVAEFSTGVGDQQFASDVRLVPNPASDLLRVLVDGANTGSIRLLAMDGRVILERSMMASTIELNITDLTAGAYMVECLLADQARPVQRRFIKL